MPWPYNHLWSPDGNRRGAWNLVHMLVFALLYCFLNHAPILKILNTNCLHLLLKSWLTVLIKQSLLECFVKLPMQRIFAYGWQDTALFQGQATKVRDEDRIWTCAWRVPIQQWKDTPHPKKKKSFQPFKIVLGNYKGCIPYQAKPKLCHKCGEYGLEILIGLE